MTTEKQTDAKRVRKSTISQAEAAQLLTVGEVRAIEDHFGGGFGIPRDQGGMHPMSTVAGLVYALERRQDLAEGRKLTSWADVDAMTLQEVTAYFAPEAIESDEDAPETPEGKDA